ncbi:TadE family protein [Quadrisphaera sp. INWT6]|uniref:TadE family protein n=1 Tax=Quadrisphaera sp. INWT6 TaxID=2596917 RepID=UPI0018924464|nr:TadE family protein [Quadrisphaera sp. INWT6]MBF5082401.1 pilus assembly protein [Quadrisphaera sp. INWT6]
MRLHPQTRVVARRPARGGDDGSASLEVVVLFPAVLLITFGLLQGALWYHARDVASAAASAGAAAARGETGTAQLGEDRARAFLVQNTDVVLAADTTVVRGGGRVSVTVSGHSLSLLPGIDGPAVEQTVTRPVERFTSRTAP